MIFNSIKKNYHIHANNEQTRNNRCKKTTHFLEQSNVHNRLLKRCEMAFAKKVDS